MRSFRLLLGVLMALALVASCEVPKKGGDDAAAVPNADAGGAGAGKVGEPTEPKPTDPKATDPTTADPKTPEPKEVKPTPPPAELAADAAAKLGTPKTDDSYGQPVVDDKALQAAMLVKTDPGELPRLKLKVDGKDFELPLKHTGVKANVVGYVAQVEVTQTYANPFDYPIETIYVFPLPENSAVNDMRIVIGERVIEAEIKKREEARQIYDDAKKEGYTAALLEQERPNVFTQSIANIAPGEEIKIVIAYAQDVTYDGGEYEWVFPVVVGPRFVPGEPTGGQSGSGWAMDTDKVPDASRITPPIVGGGMRSGADISIEANVQAGFPIVSWSVPTHEVAVDTSSGSGLQLALAEKDSIPNRDFVLRYKVAGTEPQATLLTERMGKDGYLALVLQPPALELETLVGQRELMFVVDISGSMWGKPLAMCKDAMSQALRQMQPVDTFNILTFASGDRLLWNEPRPANDTNIREALSFVDGLQAGGGTMMAGAVETALQAPLEKGRSRYVFFMTDGYVGNEAEILAKIAAFTTSSTDGGKRRVFGFGVGASTNTYLLDGMATEGDGATVYASNREDPARAVNRFYAIIDHPIVSNISIDWASLGVTEVYPKVLPDFMASRPFIVHARFDAAAQGTIWVRGESEGKAYELPINISLPAEGEKQGTVLGTLWARAKIEEFSRDLWEGVNQQAIDAITELGISHRIVTAYTSFVAVDRSRKVGDGDPTTVVQPVDGPEDVDLDMAMGERGRMGVAQSAAPTGGAMPAKPTMAKKDKSVNMAPPPSPALVAPSPAEAAPDAREEVRSSDSGSLSSADIRAVIDAKKADVKKCYEAALTRNSALAGRITVSITIGADGKVTSVRVAATNLNDTEMERCLLEILKGLVFKAPGKEVKVSYPFTFNPGD